MASQVDERQQTICIVVMGVSGTGKTTLGKTLAVKLGLSYIEGDDLHPKSNVEKMSRGIPLTDQDREPWLLTIRHTAAVEAMVVGENQRGRGRGVVVTCSALKKYYRDILRGRVKPPCSESGRTLGGHEEERMVDVVFVWIDGSKEVLEDRIGKREGHFFKASMLESQLRTLESPRDEEGVVVVPLEADTDVQVKTAIEGLRNLIKLELPIVDS